MNSTIAFHDSIRDANLNVVEYNGKVRLTDIPCPAEHNPVKSTCIGYMEVWIDSDDAKLVEFNDKVFSKTEDQIISDIGNYQTTSEAKVKTVSDLKKIIAWMTPADDKCTLYKQLCNLEGFFKEIGGFVIHNPNIKYKMVLSDFCYNEKRDPTNKRVLAVLEKFIKELTPPTATP